MVLTQPPRRRAPSATTHVLIAFRSGEAVHRHPELRRWLEQGWHIREAKPYLSEAGELKLRVDLRRSDAPPP